MTKSAIITICGRPNVGKSTLTNMLVGEKIAIVSPKPQTTRNRITGIVNHGETQFVLLDTPGFIKPRNRLGNYMMNVIRESISDVDCILFMVEPSTEVGPGEETLIENIKRSGIPAILLINKIDTVQNKKRLLEVIAAYSNKFDFEAVIPISAQTGEGMNDIFAELEKFACEGPQYFPDDMITDQPEKQICAEFIREQILKNLSYEIPHGVAVEISQFAERENGIIDIEATVYTEKSSHKGIIIGKNGCMLKKIGEAARTEMENLLGTKVFLQMWVKVKENWRNSEIQIRNFGFVNE